MVKAIQRLLLIVLTPGAFLLLAYRPKVLHYYQKQIRDITLNHQNFIPRPLALHDPKYFTPWAASAIICTYLYKTKEIRQLFKTHDEVIQYCQREKIEMIDFKMVDLLGRWRHLTIPAKRFNLDTLKYGIGFDGSNYGYAPVEKSDMVFVPDVTTAVHDPFTEVPTLSMIGDVYVIAEPHNYQFDQYPRTIANKAEKYMQDTQIADEFRISPEFEFHVFDHINYQCLPHQSGFSIDAEQAIWNSGESEFHNLGYKIPLKSGYHITPPPGYSL